MKVKVKHSQVQKKKQTKKTLRQFIATRPTLQEIQNEITQAEMKGQEQKREDSDFVIKKETLLPTSQR